MLASSPNFPSVPGGLEPGWILRPHTWRHPSAARPRTQFRVPYETTKGGCQNGNLSSGGGGEGSSATYHRVLNCISDSRQTAWVGEEPLLCHYWFSPAMCSHRRVLAMNQSTEYTVDTGQHIHPKGASWMNVPYKGHGILCKWARILGGNKGFLSSWDQEQVILTKRRKDYWSSMLSTE